MRKTLVAHLPCNYAGPQFERALRSVSWVDAVVVHDASADGSVARLAKQIRADVCAVADRDPDIRARLIRHKDVTDHDFVLWVQADEDWSGPVADEILGFLCAESDAVGLAVFNESFYFLESFGMRGPYCRVARRDKLRFPMSSLHDMPNPDGKIIQLRQKFRHFQDQNMLLFWVKNYKYSVVEFLNDGAVAPSGGLDFGGRFPLFSVLRYLLKINYHFITGMIAARGRGLAGFLWAQDLMVRQIIVQLVPLEAKRLTERNQQYETLGHFEMPALPATKPPTDR